MNNVPAHAKEHDDLITLVAKITDSSKLIAGCIVVTIGVDGRPVVGGNLGTTAQIMNVLRQLAAAEDQIADVYKIDTPRNN